MINWYSTTLNLNDWRITEIYFKINIFVLSHNLQNNIVFFETEFNKVGQSFYIASNLPKVIQKFNQEQGYQFEECDQPNLVELKKVYGSKDILGLKNN